MKNKSHLIIIIVIGLTLASTCAITLLSKQTSLTDGKKIKELRKIAEEEISDDTANEIIQFYLNKDS